MYAGSADDIGPTARTNWPDALALAAARYVDFVCIARPTYVLAAIRYSSGFGPAHFGQRGGWTRTAPRASNSFTRREIDLGPGEPSSKAQG